LSESVASEPVSEPTGAIEGKHAVHICPVCGDGRMVVVETLRAIPVNRRGLVGQEPTPESVRFDTS
jgi:hypothetical protein